MITNNEYLQQVNQVANLFCKGKPGVMLCMQNIKQRLINNLDDESWSNYFLPSMQTGRFYVNRITGLKILRLCGTAKFVFQFTIKVTDLVTGETYTHKPEHCANTPLQAFQTYLQYHAMVPVYNKPENTNQLNQPFTVYRYNAKPDYGIVYIPPTTGGGNQGGTGTSGGTGTGGTGTITTVTPGPGPTTEPVTSEITGNGGMDKTMKTILSIAAAAGAYFLLG